MYPFDIVVITHHSRPSITVESLTQGSFAARRPFKEWKAIDHNPPYKINEPLVGGPHVRQTLGDYRCVLAHQDAYANVANIHMPTLMFEDDCWFKGGPWLELVYRTSYLVNLFDVVFYSGEMMNVHQWEMVTISPAPNQYVLVSVPVVMSGIIYGCQAYLISAQAKARLMNIGYYGLPADLLLTDRCVCCKVHSPYFKHDMTHGSIIKGSPPLFGDQKDA